MSKFVLLFLVMPLVCSVLSLSSSYPTHAQQRAIPASPTCTGDQCMGWYPQLSNCAGSGGQQQELGSDNVYIGGQLFGTEHLYISYYCKSDWSAFRLASNMCIWNPGTNIGEYGDYEVTWAVYPGGYSQYCNTWLTSRMDGNDFLTGVGSQCVSGWIAGNTGFSCCPAMQYKIIRPGGVGC